VDHGLGAVENAATRLGITDVADDDLGALLAEHVRDVLLTVQQHVEHPHPATGREQLFGGGGADVAGSTRDDGDPAHTVSSFARRAWTAATRNGVQFIQ
jgi:hypothetical protein